MNTTAASGSGETATSTIVSPTAKVAEVRVSSQRLSELIENSSYTSEKAKEAVPKATADEPAIKAPMEGSNTSPPAPSEPSSTPTSSGPQTAKDEASASSLVTDTTTPADVFSSLAGIRVLLLDPLDGIRITPMDPDTNSTVSAISSPSTTPLSLADSSVQPMPTRSIHVTVPVGTTAASGSGTAAATSATGLANPQLPAISIRTRRSDDRDVDLHVRWADEVEPAAVPPDSSPRPPTPPAAAAAPEPEEPDRHSLPELHHHQAPAQPPIHITTSWNPAIVYLQ
ncbi:hypothetical protein BKA67DRAFT_235992 [Truncatella angustata]|uniref:Uncharacterized protein n=1 Tax=Truncatella angustata TaxID=152316 RepID=A0A9P8UNF5_9PEZI|nr:uncharacterized protein BKA67DRAFT_235992 [Truncatella angustata]KAH6655412.1 hypothetical protein BKA67DRAFT_235992 [Truncatella angustata]